jgi:hypothetical protein
MFLTRKKFYFFIIFIFYFLLYIVETSILFKKYFYSFDFTAIFLFAFLEYTNFMTEQAEKIMQICLYIIVN